MGGTIHTYIYNIHTYIHIYIYIHTHSKVSAAPTVVLHAQHGKACSSRKLPLNPTPSKQHNRAVKEDERNRQTNLQAIHPKQLQHEPSTPPKSLEKKKRYTLAACIPDAMLHALEQAWTLSARAFQDFRVA